MKRRLLLAAMALLSLHSLAQQPFHKPWEDTTKPVIIDVYKDNDYNIGKLLKDKRIKGIIHKMSEEDSSMFRKRRAEAGKYGLYYGSYWLPKYDTNGTAQADAYLNMVGDSMAAAELLALDFEMHKKTGQFISPLNASRFVQRIYERTGRYPYIYCGLNNLPRLEHSPYKEIFARCRLWIIALTKDGDINHVFKDKTVWTTYGLWQFSCEINCCGQHANRPCFYKVPGIECGVDYDIFNGDLQKDWAH